MERPLQPENKRRRSKFTLYRHRYVIPVIFGSMAGAVAVHFLLYHLLVWCGYSFDVSNANVAQPPVTDIERLVVLSSEDKNEPAPPELPEHEELPHETLPEPEPLDADDFNPEELVIAPGETDLGMTDSAMIEKMSAEAFQSQMDIQKIKSGMPDPSKEMVAPITANPVAIPAVAASKDSDPDEWYREKLKGAGGKDDSNLPDGTKSFEQLLGQKQGTLGKGSGHARIGADLLFEYDKAIMKGSARIGLLQLASLICKNPATVFVIEGHSDSFGSEQYNYLLSLMRANAVRLWLKDNGIPLKNIYVRGCGATRPVVSLKGDKDAQAANRRVEIHMRKKGEEIPPDAKAHNFEIDMKTPVAAQIAAMGGKVLDLPRETKEVKALPPHGTAKPIPPSKPAVAVPTVKKTPPQTVAPKKEEIIPLAEPVNDEIPHAEEIIPDAVPL